MEHDDKGKTGLADMLAIDASERRESLSAHAIVLQSQMEEIAEEIRKLIAAQPPVALLGYLLGQIHITLMYDTSNAEETPRLNSQTLQQHQLALEYAHAVWSSEPALPSESTRLNEDEAAKLLEAFERLSKTTMLYCMASSAASRDPERPGLAEMQFHAKSSWSLIRGHRYQVLEEEFFRYVLRPHDDALRLAYGMDSGQIAASIQGIADSMRAGFSNAAEGMMQRFEQANVLLDETGNDLETVMKTLAADDDTFVSSTADLINDMLFGGTSNLSRHTAMTAPLLEDLCFLQGENTEFFAEGPFRGTPMRTLPAHVKPGVKLGEEFYAPEPQFVRDAAYRAIQRGLCGRLPYRDEWLKRQGVIAEEAFPIIFSSQLSCATLQPSVFYRDVESENWAETDLLIAVEDCLLVIEAKAGTMPMHSPATNFKAHERAIQDLVVKAYRQCRRFIEYLDSAAEVPIYRLIDGVYTEICKLKRADYRSILPIGLTIEAFTPFSAAAKELPEVAPILGGFPFVSMSVDDLFVLNRFLPTAGYLLHYLKVRQAVAGIPSAMLFDEVDHLGAYISRNRIDMDIREALAEADRITLDAFCEVVDRYFEGPDWEAKPAPSQPIPATLERILAALDALKPKGWLAMDNALRDLDTDARERISTSISELEPTLHEKPQRRFMMDTEEPLQVWLCRIGHPPDTTEFVFGAQAACLSLEAPQIRVLTLFYDRPGSICQVSCAVFSGPSPLQSDFRRIREKADLLKERARNL
jgi:hypothetical protein